MYAARDVVPTGSNTQPEQMSVTAVGVYTTFGSVDVAGSTEWRVPRLSGKNEER